MSSLERILPFLRPIQDLLVDPDITEVMVNAGGRRIFVERGGVVEAVPARTVDERLLTVAIKNIARTCGDEISEDEPILDARLEDGSRVAAMFPPCSVSGPTLTIRRFSRRYSLEDLVAVGSVPVDAAALLRSAVATPTERADFGWDGYRKDDTVERAGGHDSRHGSHRADRGDVRDSAREAKLCAVRSAEGRAAAWRHRRTAAGDDRGPAACHVASPSRSDHRRRSAWAPRRSICCRR